ncbi:aromatic ring-hydroxylating oxygenase subunit alpha [Aromatoleum petrolei]|uniref:Rieske 2Fe-2S domain-containing protein n=1 Tax=Aromatoleum petrolei TaxID=76116 RepID=A0ABX1MP48_9RHOO|nr:aromatic ring-hydroxylating dioxygenase subunit alpha [Aromatoleum petrolei]NMF89719.1 Rieske 2Fe-2S domain-containing protein [Aromatoleum petrolei]QTQ37360.1 Putative iron-sulfur protein [Aromatoleum petrolei]
MDKEAIDELKATARDVLDHARNTSFRFAPEVMTIDASVYTDPARFEREKRRLFRRLPLMLAASCEMPAAGDYKTIEVAGVPVLLMRGKDGVARAFLNACTHRAAILAEGTGNASRFTCPYHGWTFTNQGALLGVASQCDFGTVNKETMGLREFPTVEKAGLIWAVLDTRSTLDIDAFLSGYDAMLEGFGLANWHLVDSRCLKGANWKLAFDAHLEFYHIPVLHKNTFGPAVDNKALYYFSGPHQRLIRSGPVAGRVLPDEANLFNCIDTHEADWPTEAMMLGEWILFPHVSINSFYDGGRGVIVSQVFPGKTVDESFTIQTYLMEREPDEVSRAEAVKRAEFLAHVVNDEDLPTSNGQQRVLESGLLPTICYGKNEGGLQHFHRWVDRIVDTDDAELNALFRECRKAA